MSNPIDHLGDIDEALNLVHEAALRYLSSLPERPVRPPAVELIAPTLGGTLPEEGAGTLEAVRELLDAGMDAAIGSAGGCFFHFVVGGATPAALDLPLSQGCSRFAQLNERERPESQTRSPPVSRSVPPSLIRWGQGGEALP